LPTPVGDHHQELNKKLKVNCDITDRPIGALIRDLKGRGLLDSTLLVWAGEFGAHDLWDSSNASTKTRGAIIIPIASVFGRPAAA
jgi:hypothetical protein